jgi:transcriptional regulator with XRE-family HTH domain
MTINKQIGKRIQYLRNQKGISQLDLSLEAGVNRNYLSDLERGERNPTLKVLVKIAEALGVDLSTLVQGVKEDL